jgi:hypothetical protein
MKLRELFIREQSQDEYTVVVILVNDDRIIRVPGIPMSRLTSDDFEERLEDFIKQSYPNIRIDDWYLVDRRGRVTDIRALNPKPDPEGEIEPTPDEAPSGSGADAPEVDTTPPAQPSEPEVDTDPDTPEEPAQDTAPAQDAAPAQPNEPEADNAPEVDTEIPPPPRAPENPQAEIPVEALPQEQQQQLPVQVTLISPEEFEEMLAASGGGEDGAEGEEGAEGEAGSDAPSDGLTESEVESIPEITEALYDALRGGWAGFFTDDETIFNELDKITRREHFDAISQSYEAMTGEPLLDRLVLHYNREGAEPVQRLNRIIGRFGYQLEGTTGAGLAGKLRHVDTGGSSNVEGEPSEAFTPTDEEREQMAEARYIYEQILSNADESGNFSQIEPIEYTAEDGSIAFIRNPAERFELEDKPTSEIMGGDLIRLKNKIAELFPLISGARGSSPESEAGPMQINVDAGLFAYTRELEGKE